MERLQREVGREVLSPGAVIADRWELEEPVSHGHRSEVWRCLDRRLERTVALKLIRAEYIQDRSALRSFERQLRLLGGVEDPHVMRIFDAVVHGGRLILICELIDGIHLDHSIERRGALTADEVTALGVQLARGLAAMHVRGLVHRDVRPHNVMIGRDGGVKLVGVGAVKWALTDSTITDRASLLAEAAYLAPEQLAAGSIDPRVDVYAAGIVLWEALAGRRPEEILTGEDPLGDHHLVDRPSSVVRRVPAALDDLIWRATAVDPGERFADARELAGALEALAPARPTVVTSGLLRV